MLYDEDIAIGLHQNQNMSKFRTSIVRINLLYLFKIYKLYIVSDPIYEEFHRKTGEAQFLK